MRRGWFPLVPVLALGFGVAGCAGPSTPPAGTPPPRDILAWRGATAGELEQGLGPPDATYRLASGETVLEYSWTRTQTTGGYTVNTAGSMYTGSTWDTTRQYVPTRVVSLNCRARFTLGADDRVRNIGWQGQGCLSNRR